MVLASASFFGGAWTGTAVLRYRSWIQRFVAPSLMTTKRQRCWLPPLGARVPASSTFAHERVGNRIGTDVTQGALGVHRLEEAELFSHIAAPPGERPERAGRAVTRRRRRRRR